METIADPDNQRSVRFTAPARGLSKFERTVIAVVASGVCGTPGDYPGAESPRLGDKTREQKYGYQVLRIANAVWDALEKDGGS
jgi:hypothetical protein